MGRIQEKIIINSNNNKRFNDRNVILIYHNMNHEICATENVKLIVVAWLHALIYAS